ncbi:hypothetical protein F511_10356 [Dorcoceras hygrometricum]|uniref:Protein EI24 n=1 Tax=Dorcoceras hygrometricum TaxID=472368 RepID=A0A2Z7CNN1_9LAMI|nr:hypothetical protein F511_10356 [Dorcoceras hygrometricum]
MDSRIRNLMGNRNTPKLKQASLLWLEGFREALCLHRVIIYCLRSKELAIRTGQCFLLNGFIFLGSIFVLRSVVIPTIEWLLPDGCQHIYLEEPCWGVLGFYSCLRLGLIQLFYVFWFYPMYIFSFVLSTIWYNDIAKYGFFAFEKSGSWSSDQKDTRDSLTKTSSDTTGIEGYKWNYSGLSLDKRLDFFESNWPFFAGFDLVWYCCSVDGSTTVNLPSILQVSVEHVMPLVQEESSKDKPIQWRSISIFSHSTNNFLWSHCRTFDVLNPFRNRHLWSNSDFIQPLVSIPCILIQHMVESVVSLTHQPTPAESARLVNTPVTSHQSHPTDPHGSSRLLLVEGCH